AVRLHGGWVRASSLEAAHVAFRGAAPLARTDVRLPVRRSRREALRDDRDPARAPVPPGPSGPPGDPAPRRPPGGPEAAPPDAPAREGQPRGLYRGPAAGTPPTPRAHHPVVDLLPGGRDLPARAGGRRGAHGGRRGTARRRHARGERERRG